MRRVPCRSLLVAVVSTGMVATAGVCASPAAQAASAASVTLTGARKSATRVPFQISPQVSASVDVGTGNLMVSTHDWNVPAVNGQLQPLGLAYNSLTLGSGSAVTTADAGKGWFVPLGTDTRLIKNDDGSVLFLASDSEQGLFKAASGGGYTPPPTMNKTLVKNSDGTWTVTDVPSLQTMHFTASGHLDKITDRNGNHTTFTYTSGNVSSIKTGAGSVVEVGHDSKGFISSMADYAGHFHDGFTPARMRYNYDDAGHLTSIEQIGSYFVGQFPPTTTEASFTYSSAGDLASITDGDGLKTSFVYDSSHRVTSVSQGKDSDLAITRFKYLSSTHTDVADPNTDQSKDVVDVPHTIYYFDSSTKLVTKALDPLGHEQSATYTSFNDVASATNAVSGKTTNDYSSGVNGGHSVTQSTSPTGATQKATYGTGKSAYNRASGTDQQGNKSVMTYDGAGNPASTTANGGANAQVHYNSDGTLASSTDPAGKKTTYTNDPDGKYITKITPPDGSKLGPTTIDGVPATSITNGAGQETDYTYDALDHLTQSKSADVTVNYAYTDAERLQTRTDGNQKVTYGYDNRGNLASIATTPVAVGAPPASTVGYGYDKVGNMTAKTIDGKTIQYRYDAANRLTSMSDSADNVTRFAYDDNDHRTDTWWHTNTDHSTFAAHTHNEFDKSGRLTRTWTARNNSDSTRVFDSSYSYAKSGSDSALIQSITNNQASADKTATLTYDSQNRLTKATNWLGKDYVYSYDKSGNRTTETTDGKTTQSLTFNADNEISSTGYTYDKAGRRTKDAKGGGEMTYNSAGQMIKQKTSQADASFMYAGDTQDELIQQNSQNGTTNYTFGRADQAGTPTVESFTQTGASNTSVTFHNDAAGQPIDFTQDGNSLYVMYDGLGQTRATLKADGTVNGTVDPDPWGAWFPHDGAANAKNSPSKMVTSAAGGSQSPWTTLGIGNQAVPGFAWWKRGARWNDTTTGTWTTVDPITMLNNPNRANSYTYAGDDPINTMDPNGRDAGDYAKGCAQGAGEGLLVGAVTGADETGAGAVGAAASGCVDGLITTAADDLTDSSVGSEAGYIADGIEIVSSLL